MEYGQGELSIVEGFNHLSLLLIRNTAGIRLYLHLRKIANMTIIAGPCVIESPALLREVAAELARIKEGSTLRFTLKPALTKPIARR